MTNTTAKFKNSTIGKIPVDWEVKKLEDFLNYIQPTNYLNDNLMKLYSSENTIPVLTAGKSFILGYTKDDQKTFSNIPAILFDDFTTENKYVNFPFKVRSTAAKILVAKNSDFSFKFVFEALQQINFVSIDHKRYWISEFQFLKFPFPSLPEQQKIAEISFTWDKAIQKTEAIIKNLELRNKGLAKMLFFKNDKKSNQKQMMKVVDRIRNSFTPEEYTLYKQIGIRSHAKGLFYKEAVTGKSLGNKSVFWIEANCFIVNIVFAWERAIGKTTDADIGFIASHRFPMYKPKEGVLNLDYLLYFFKSHKGKYLLELASPGGAGRNKTLGQTEFLKLKIPVPSMEEQNRLVDILDTANKELKQYQEKLSNLKLQKKGLMQQLLTGKVRTI